MKILHLATHLNVGGVTRYIALSGEALRRRGHEVWAASGGGICEAELSAAGVRCLRFPLKTKSIAHPKIYLGLAGMVRQAREGRFDLLHAHSHVAQVAAALISRATGIPYVSTAHGFYSPRWGRRLFDTWGERVVAVSPLVAEELKKTHGLDGSRVRVVQNAIDAAAWAARAATADRSALRRRYGIPEKAFVALSVSRLVRDKGHEFLLDALKMLLPERPDLFVVIAGDGRERKRLMEMRRALGLEGHCALLPSVEDIAGLLAASDLFVHPATYREGFGLSIAEAMAASKPVIVTDIPALNTLFEHGKDSLIVPPKDAAALAAAIRRLAVDHALASELARAGHRKVMEVSSLDRMGEALENVYLEAAGSRSAKGAS